ncbi:MAG TPA: glycosyltransferase [Verrucomicrobium sp.]|nr:glycosyltransferase [Verrucomicrobium sp.]
MAVDMVRPEIAVIIPLYNGARWIAETLQSVKAQTLQPAEVVVVDDHSQDGGPDLVREFEGVQLFSNPKKGGGPGRDFGLAATRAPWVTFLDQDDLWAPHHLESLANLLAAHPQAVAAAAKCKAFESQVPAFDDRGAHHVARKLDMWDHFPFGLIECPSLVLARRSAFAHTGNWSDQTPTMADLELWLRMALHGDVLTSDLTTVARRVHSGSFSGALRSENISRYLDSLLRCGEKLAALRLSASPEERDKLHERLEVILRLQIVAKALLQRDGATFCQSVARYEDSLPHAPSAFRTTALANLVWFLDPAVRSGGLALRNWWALYRERLGSTTPLQTLMTAAARKWPAPLRWRHWVRRPWDAERWKLVRGQNAIGATISIEQHGVDEDGWAEAQCRFRDLRSSSDMGLSIRIEIPYWAGRIESQVTIRQETGESFQTPLRNGIYEIHIQGTGNRPAFDRQAPTVTLKFDHAFALPGENRQRSARILEVGPLRQSGPQKILVVRSTGRKAELRT